MSSIVTNVLDLSKIQSGNMKLLKEPANLRVYVLWSSFVCVFCCCQLSLVV